VGHYCEVVPALVRLRRCLVRLLVACTVLWGLPAFSGTDPRIARDAEVTERETAPPTLLSFEVTSGGAGPDDAARGAVVTGSTTSAVRAGESACCDHTGACLGDLDEVDCAGSNGVHYPNATCGPLAPDLPLAACQPPGCGFANGQVLDAFNTPPSQYAPDHQWAAGAADDFELPSSTSGACVVTQITVYIRYFNVHSSHTPNPVVDFDGITVTVYADDNGQPAGRPLDDGGHIATVPGGMLFSETLTTFSSSGSALTPCIAANDDSPGTAQFRIDIAFDPNQLILPNGRRLWLEVQPVMNRLFVGQTALLLAEESYGEFAKQIFPLIGWHDWIDAFGNTGGCDGLSPGTRRDFALEILAEPADCSSPAAADCNTNGLADSCEVVATGLMFWVLNGTVDSISRANLDGAGVENIVTSADGLSGPKGIVVDRQGQRVYWSDLTTSKIQSADFDGSDIQDIRTGVNVVDDLAIATDIGKLYWSGSAASIHRANLDGTASEVVVSGLNNPQAVEVDNGAAKLYWTDLGTRTIERADLDGTNREVLLDLTTCGVCGASGNAYALAIDGDDGRMYWTNDSANTIQRAYLDGSDVETLVTSLNGPRGLVLDLTARKLYWTDSALDHIRRANLDGTNPETVLAGIDAPWGIDLVSNLDCDGNGVPDECDADCNANGVPDACDISAGTNEDCDGDSVPDGCPQQSTELIANDIDFDNFFGLSVAISGHVAVIGAPGEGASDRGSAYVFRKVDGVWQQIAKLTAADAAANDFFGRSVSLSGNTAIVGAQDDDGGSNSGSAYAFREVGGVWQQIAKLTAADAAADDQFGTSVALAGDTAIIGASLDDDAGSDSGSAYVFREIGGVWQQIGKLTADDATSTEQFGVSVAVSEGTAIVGASGDDDAGSASGSAYVFREVGGVWQQIAKLTAADAAAGDLFGISVSLTGETAVVGAYFDDDAGPNSGSAYVFREVGGVWQQIAKLTAADGAAGDEFGVSVSVSGNTALVGAILDDDGGLDSGSAYVFRESAGFWQQSSKFTATDAVAGDLFGFAVAIGNGAALVAAPYHNHGIFTDAGAAYVHDLFGPDCDENGVADACDIAAGAADCDLDGVPDVCQPDCDDDGTPDTCAIGETWFAERFDGYAEGSSIHGQGGWKGWDNNPAFDAEVSSDERHSLPYAVDIRSDADLVQEFSGVTAGRWSLTAWQYIPSWYSGASNFILLNTYNDGGPYNWSTQLVFDAATGQIVSDPEGLPVGSYITGAWVPLGVEIDLDADTQTFFYDGVELLTKSWTEGASGGGALNFAALDLFANSASSVYYDDLSLVEQVNDCDANGVPDDCELAAGTSEDCNANDVPDACELTAGTGTDCNANEVLDDCDIAAGSSGDCNANELPDDCEFDCDDSGVPDDCEPFGPTGADCNGNGVPDACDVRDGVSSDCNGNGLPDECDMAGGIYWTNDNLDRLSRAGLDGQNAEDVIETGLSLPRGIAVDRAAGKVYWVDSSTDKIQRANLDGSDVEDLVLSAGPGARSIAMDPAAGRMYWTRSGGIARANLDGTAVETLYSSGISGYYGIALDPAESHIYWSRSGGFGGPAYLIQRANLDGSGGTVDLVVAPTIQSTPSAIALDLAGEKLYWVEHTHGVKRANLDGSGSQLVASPGGFSTYEDIALNVSAGKMYWTRRGPLPGGVQRADLNGTGVQFIVGGPSDSGFSGIALIAAAADCNTNGVLDGCDIIYGTSSDCDYGGIPDECESSVDCNVNGVDDGCDIASGSSMDCNVNAVPDECEPVATDCNSNGVLDECDVAAGTSGDCNINSTPDECEVFADCNTNGTPDVCELLGSDCNTNSVPDDCEPVPPGDYDDDGVVSLNDQPYFVDCLNGPGLPPAPTAAACIERCLQAFDADDDGDVDLQDFAGFSLMIAPDPILANLEAYWKFDGDGLDSSGNLRDVALFGAAGYGMGLFGSALSLNGNASNYARRTADDPELSWTNSDYTIQVWVNHNTVSGEQLLIEKWIGCCGPGWTLTKIDNQRLRLASFNGPGFNLDTPPIATAGVWHHVVVRRQGGTSYRIFWDGTSVASTTNSFAYPEVTTPVLIGKRNDPPFPFPMNGRLDEIALWSRALSDGEIQALYNGGAGVELPVP